MPRFSFIIIAYNAANTIKNLLNDLNSQDFDHNDIEVLLVNSASTDSTCKIMESFVENCDFLSCKVLQNPKKILAAGWNVALDSSTGDVIVKIDAHARIEKDFLSNVDKNINTGEDIVGGQRPTVFENTNHTQRMLAHAEASMFGSGIAIYRRSIERKYVSTLAHAAYKREVFEKVGKFNENLVRTEDNEIHYRMRKAGYKFCLCPDIISYQHARSSLKSMLKQKWGNGYWIGLTLGVCPKCFSLYNFVPFGFVISIIISALLGLACHSFILLFGILTLYFLCAVAFTIKAMKAEKDSRVLLLMTLLPLVFLVMHLVYGLGTLAGIIIMPFWRLKHNGHKN